MRKKYYIVLIALAIMLVTSIIVIGVLSNKLLNKKQKETYYELGNVKVLSIEKVTNKKLELISYSYNISDNLLEKVYVYKYENNLDGVLEDYCEYLVINKGFIISDDNGNEKTLTFNDEDEHIYTFILTIDTSNIKVVFDFA